MVYKHTPLYRLKRDALAGVADPRAKRARPTARRFPARIEISRSVSAASRRRKNSLRRSRRRPDWPRNRFIDEIEQAYGRQLAIVRLDLDALKHEIRKYAGVGVIELPSFLGPEQQRAN
jgi:uncharacterized sporulation protein YeaH/YhbH (DUF444 family)